MLINAHKGLSCYTWHIIDEKQTRLTLRTQRGVHVPPYQILRKKYKKCQVCNWVFYTYDKFKYNIWIKHKLNGNEYKVVKKKKIHYQKSTSQFIKVITCLALPLNSLSPDRASLYKAYTTMGYYQSPCLNFNSIEVEHGWIKHSTDHGGMYWFIRTIFSNKQFIVRRLMKI